MTTSYRTLNQIFYKDNNKFDVPESIHLLEDFFYKGEILDKREIDHRENNESYNKEFVNKILSAVYKLRRNSRKDYKIRVNVVKKYFGIDDGKQKTLREVGEQFGFSKERTRMLVDDTIDTIKELNFCYDPLD